MKRIFTAVVTMVVAVVFCFMTLAAPAYALSANLNISDYLSGIQVNGSDKTVLYEIDVPVYITVTAGGSQFASSHGSIVFKFPDAAKTTGIVNIYHFGEVLYPNASSASYGLLDVSDIMNGATVNLDLDFEFRLGTSSAIPMSAVFSYKTNIIAYSQDKQRIETFVTDSVNTELQPEGACFIENAVDYTLPSNTAYIGCVTQVYFSTGFDLTGMSCSVSSEPVCICVNSNMIYEQSQSMVRIEQQLGDIIFGTPEQNESAENSAGEIADQKEQIGSLVDQMQTHKPNMDNVDISAGALAPSAGVTTLSGAISPILENDLIKRILLMAATLALVSTVLFGKKE